MKNNSRISDAILAITACLLWGTAFVGVKVGLKYMSPLVLAGIRFILAAFLVIPFCGGIATIRRTFTQHTKTVLVVGLFQTFLLYGFFFLAMQYVGGAVAAIVIGSSPLVSALVAHVMMKDDKMTAKNSLAILFGTLGVIVISVSCKPWDPVGLPEFIGVMILLCGSFVSAVGNVVVAQKKDEVHAIALNCTQMFSGGVLLLIAGLVFEGVPTVMLPAKFFITLLWLAFISAVGFSTWFYLLGRIKVSRLNVWKFLIPVSGAILSWIMLPNESPTISAVAGLVLVTAGVLTAGSRGASSAKSG